MSRTAFPSIEREYAESMALREHAAMERAESSATPLVASPDARTRPLVPPGAGVALDLIAANEIRAMANHARRSLGQSLRRGWERITKHGGLK